MICTRIKQQLNQAKLDGFLKVEIDAAFLTSFEVEDIKECGFNIFLNNGKFIISE